MMNYSGGAMDGMCIAMMWGMGAAGLLLVLGLVLGVAALVKYLFFNARRGQEVG